MDELFLADENHGSMACVDCHGGDPEQETRALAHVGMAADPTLDPAASVCASCHQQIATDSATSLHTTLAGIRQSLIDRAGGTMPPELDTAFGNHCGRCHSSCGDCHISMPATVGGGLLSGHQIRKTPPMALVCTACHGSRVSDEYRGDNPGLPADAHYFKGLQCTSCHGAAEMHGSGDANATHRYQVSAAPRCVDCHPADAAFDQTLHHTLHKDPQGDSLLSCQVCHSVGYKTCSSCHVSLSAEGDPIYEVNAPSFESVLTFKIGKNPMMDSLHPEKWVPVRHVPIDPDNYAYYGAELLSAFDVSSTWKLATPHNVQRNTPQTASCDSCHGQRELFLAPEDLHPYEIDANAGVVVSDAELP